MYVVFENKGQQYALTKENQIIYIAYQKNTKPNDKIIFDRVLSDGEEFGHPYLSNVRVIGEIIKHGKKKKIYVLKYKPKKRQIGNNLKGQGHRQQYTQVKITKVEK